LKREHSSVLRNPRIAEALYQLGYIEKWGVGALLVLRECIRNGNGEPEFRSDAWFKATVYSRLHANLTEQERKIVSYLKSRGEATRKQIQEALGVKESTARKYLLSLQLKGRL